MRKQVTQTILTCCDRFDATPLDWHRGKKRVQGIRGEAYELRSTHSDRVIAREYQGRLAILAFGPHDVVDKYVELSQTRREAELLDALPADFFDEVRRSSLFAEAAAEGEIGANHAEELGADWMWFLGDEQLRASDKLMATAKAGEPGEEPIIGYLRGGAGTGKTAVLLDLAQKLHASGQSVELRCSLALQQHLARYAQLDVGEYVRPKGTASIILVDDPAHPKVVTSTLAAARTEGHLAVIFGFDPLQWRDKRLAEALDSLPEPDEDITLHTCYRQAEYVAAQAIDIVQSVHQRSSWRSDSRKVADERAVLSELEEAYLSGMTFAKRGGRSGVADLREFPLALANAIESLKGRWDRWEDLPELLILEDEAHGARLSEVHCDLLAGVNYLPLPLRSIEQYRGLDFQSVWLLLDPDYYDRLQLGVTGLSKSDWEELRDLHIALTRAKDESLIFVLP